MAVFDEREDFLSRPGWDHGRRGGIGGTDIAAIVGMSKWKKPIDVWLAKTGRGPKTEMTQIMRMGHRMEAVIRDEYEYLTQCKVFTGEPLVDLVKPYRPARSWNGAAIVEHPECSYFIGSPDGLVDLGSCGLEIKNVRWKTEEWGPNGSDQVPSQYVVQCAWYMHILGVESWDLAALFGGNTVEIFPQQRNPNLEKILVESAHQFWNDYIVKGLEPPIDASEQYASYLASKFAMGTEKIIDATDDMLPWVNQLAAAKGVIDAAEISQQEAKNHLAAMIADCKGVKGQFGKITWVRPKPSKKTDWETAFADLSQLFVGLNPVDGKSDIEQVIACHTEPSQKSAYLKSTFNTLESE